MILCAEPTCTISLKIKLRGDIGWLDKKIRARCPPSDCGWSKTGGESADIHPSGCHLESRQRVEEGGWGEGVPNTMKKVPKNLQNIENIFFLKSIYTVPRCL